MSTVTAVTCPPVISSSTVRMPASVSMLIGLSREMPCSYAYFATQRMPLPHISEPEPSALYMSISASAPG